MPLGFGKSIIGQVAVASEPGLAAIDPNESLFGGTTSISNTSSESEDVTMAIWFKDGDGTTAGSSVADTFFRFFHTTGGTSLLGMEYQGGRMRLLGLDGSRAWAFDYLIGTYNPTYNTAGTYDDGNWHHLVYSRDGSASTEHLFVDGSSTGFSVNAGRQNFSNNPIVWQGPEFAQVSVLSESHNSANNPVGCEVCQLFVDNVYYNLSDSATLQKFYNGGAVDMGSDGTGSGLAAPVVFHHGDTSTFLTNAGDGSFAYTLTTSGSGSDVSTSNGPQFA